MLQTQELVDALADEMEMAEAERRYIAFYSNTHTYDYTLAGGVQASARLDRWYLSARTANWIRDVSKAVAGPKSYHNGVALRMTGPQSVEQHRKLRRIYPVVAPMTATADTIVTHALDEATKFRDNTVIT